MEVSRSLFLIPKFIGPIRKLFSLWVSKSWTRIEGETSTWGEGIHNLQKLKENKFKSFILVTSAFHTNRAHAVYEKLINHLGYDFKFMVYPAKDNRIPINDWWKSRTGRKHILLEYLSTLNFYREHL